MAVAFTAHAQDARPDASRACARVAQAAEEGARLRDQGLTRDATSQALSKSFSEYEVGMGSTAAFTYTALREFAMADFVESYCRLMVAKNGKPSDSDSLLIKTQYDRSAECASQGRAQKQAFLQCWNEQYRKATEPMPSTPR